MKPSTALASIAAALSFNPYDLPPMQRPMQRPSRFEAPKGSSHALVEVLDAAALKRMRKQQQRLKV